jgi:signal transduction histidine kinase
MELEKAVAERTAELKKAIETLAEKNNELERMNKDLESFAYISSHDLQEPLRKIQTFTGRILETEYQNLSENGKSYFSRMQGSAKRMQTLIEDLLAYSRASNVELVFEKADLKDVIEEVQTELKEALLDKEAIVIVSDTCEANIIPFQFRQLLHNLIGNALKFSKPGVPPQILINCRVKQGDTLQDETLSLPAGSLLPSNKYCHISVSDNGIGFKPEFKDRIFEIFQRLHEKSEFDGTGIGLAIVKKIVENHQGIITATSEPNKGARFDIYIPS